jgi:hypothetical protein
MGSPDEILIGWTGTGTERSGRMQQLWPNGSFAEKALYAAQCLTVLPGAESRDDVTRLPFLASLAIADGGFRRGGLRGAQSVIINGATGNLGGAAAMVALARGASRVVVVGRGREALNRLVDLDSRVTAVELSGIRDADAAAVRHASDGGADLVLDVIAHTPTPDPTLACIDALRVRGTAVLVGGVRHDLPIDYQRIQRQQLAIVGSFMFDQATVTELWNLFRSGAPTKVPRPAARYGDAKPGGGCCARGRVGGACWCPAGRCCRAGSRTRRPRYSVRRCAAGTWRASAIADSRPVCVAARAGAVTTRPFGIKDSDLSERTAASPHQPRCCGDGRRRRRAPRPRKRVSGRFRGRCSRSGRAGSAEGRRTGRAGGL